MLGSSHKQCIHVHRVSGLCCSMMCAMQCMHVHRHCVCSYKHHTHASRALQCWLEIMHNITLAVAVSPCIINAGLWQPHQLLGAQPARQPHVHRGRSRHTGRALGRRNTPEQQPPAVCSSSSSLGSSSRYRWAGTKCKHLFYKWRPVCIKLRESVTAAAAAAAADVAVVAASEYACGSGSSGCCCCCCRGCVAGSGGAEAWQQRLHDTSRWGGLRQACQASCC
jgi:hypothetical protein